MKKFYNLKNQEIWQQTWEKQEALFVGYLIAGDPTLQESLKIVQNSFLSGMDILELGIPSQNPYLDGAIIRSGHTRVNHDIGSWLPIFWKVLRQQVNNPMWAMGYKVELYDTGLYQDLAKWGLIDALVLPDCSFEQRNLVELSVREYGVDVVQFVKPSMTDREIELICSQATIVYAQTYEGNTGDSTAKLENLAALYQKIRTYSNALIIAGFGLSTPEKVRVAVESSFDGVVVGSALVAKCVDGQQKELYHMISEMKLKTDLLIKGN